MSSTEYSPGKWNVTGTFIHRDSLDPIIEKLGVQVFNKERHERVDNLYVRYNGEKAQYVVPDGKVIIGVRGKLAMLRDFIRDPAGKMLSQVFYRFSHFYVATLKYINKYDGSWENSTEVVELPGNYELQKDWEFDTQNFDQKFVRGYFLTGLIFKQGALAPMSDGPMPVNIACTVQSKHYLKGYMKEYTFGDKRAGVSLDAGLSIPDFRRTIAGIKYDASVIYFNPFFEVTNFFVKDVWFELPEDSHIQGEEKEESEVAKRDQDIEDNDTPTRKNNLPIKTDPSSDSSELPETREDAIAGSEGDYNQVNLDEGANVIPQDKTLVEKGLDYYNKNPTPVIIGIAILVIFILYATSSPPSKRRLSEFTEESTWRRGNNPYGTRQRVK